MLHKPAPAAGRAPAAASASTRLRPSAQPAADGSLSRGPKRLPLNWSEPGFSCCACPAEECRAGRMEAGAAGPAGVDGAEEHAGEGKTLSVFGLQVQNH